MMIFTPKKIFLKKGKAPIKKKGFIDYLSMKRYGKNGVF
jgi:hypothetical protein